MQLSPHLSDGTHIQLATGTNIENKDLASREKCGLARAAVGRNAGARRETAARGADGWTRLAVVKGATGETDAAMRELRVAVVVAVAETAARTNVATPHLAEDVSWLPLGAALFPTSYMRCAAAVGEFRRRERLVCME